jgi:hypothetical protein
MAKKAAARKKTGKTAGRKTAGRKTPVRKATKKAAKRATKSPRKGLRRSAARRSSSVSRPASITDVRGADVRRDIGGVRLEVGRAGEGRVKRMVYPPGYKWSVDTKPHVGTDYCMHAHVGFLVQGRIDVIYSDGCVEVFEAPQVVAVAPGHDGHVVGGESAVLIEFDFEGDTAARFGMPDAHRHE